MFDFIEKKKSWICFIAVLLAILLTAFAYYGYKIDNTINNPKKSKVIGSVTSFDKITELSSGDTLVQKYKLKNMQFKELGMYMDLSDNGKIKINVAYGDQSTEVTLTGDDVLTGAYTYIDLPRALYSSEAETLEIKINVLQGEFKVHGNATKNIGGSYCEVNGQKVSSNAVVDLRTSRSMTPYVLYWVFVFGGMLLLTAVFLLAKTKKAGTAEITAIILLVLGISCSFIFPPFTVPDEQTHYRAVYHVSNQMMFDFEDQQNALHMRESDYEYCMASTLSLLEQDYVDEMGFYSLKCEKDQIISKPDTYMTKKTVPYFFPAAGLTLSRIVGLGAYWTFQVSRIFNIIQSVILIYFAIKIIPFGKGALAAISLLPINLHIRASVSYDAFTYGGVLLMFAFIIKLIYDKKAIGWKQLLLLALMIVLVIPQKVVYIGVAALVLIIPKERFAKPKWHFAIKCALGVIAVAATFILQISGISKLSSDTVTYSSEVAGFSLSYVLTHIPQVVNLLFNTIIDQGDFYLSSMTSYFGWFELCAPWFTMVPFIVLLVLSFMRKEDEPQPQRLIEKMYAIMLFAFVFVLTEIILLIDHTTRESMVIQGVQGRYFLPALPLLIVAARNNTLVLKKNFDSILLCALTALNVFTFMHCLSIIIPS